MKVKFSYQPGEEKRAYMVCNLVIASLRKLDGKNPRVKERQDRQLTANISDRICHMIYTGFAECTTVHRTGLITSRHLTAGIGSLAVNRCCCPAIRHIRIRDIDCR